MVWYSSCFINCCLFIVYSAYQGSAVPVQPAHPGAAGSRDGGACGLCAGLHQLHHRRSPGPIRPRQTTQPAHWLVTGGGAVECFGCGHLMTSVGVGAVWITNIVECSDHKSEQQSIWWTFGRTKHFDKDSLHSLTHTVEMSVRIVISF